MMLYTTVGLISGGVKILKTTAKVIRITYDGGKTVRIVTDTGRQIEFPTSRIINFKYRGSVNKPEGELGKKYPEGVRFSEAGFPDFSPYCLNEVEINVTGNRKTDAGLANKEAGYEKTPENYEWHHVEDCRTMQLVPWDLHRTVKHTGGVSLIRYIETN